MRDQDAVCTRAVDLDMGLDGITAAAHVRCDVGRHMTHAGMKDKIVARALESRSVLRKTNPETVVERQHVVLFGLAPPQFYQFGQTLRLFRREVIGLGKIPVEMKQLPLVVLE